MLRLKAGAVGITTIREQWRNRGGVGELSQVKANLSQAI